MTALVADIGGTKVASALVSNKEKSLKHRMQADSVSLDENANDLNDFLAKYAKPKIVPVNYQLLGGQPEIQKLAKLGINFVGSIPCIALLDDNNKIIVEGKFDEKYIDAMISLLVKNK